MACLAIRYSTTPQFTSTKPRLIFLGGPEQPDFQGKIARVQLKPTQQGSCECTLCPLNNGVNLRHIVGCATELKMV